MIYIAADKHGLKAIQMAEDYLKIKDLPYINLGVKSPDVEIKLEEIIPQVTQEVLKNPENNRGILACGTGVGVEVGANKFAGIRACLATDEKVAEWAVVKDKCNVLCLVGWMAQQDQIYKILDAWFNAKFDANEKRLKSFEVFDTWH